MARTITMAQWRALLARWPEGRVPLHFTVWGEGPRYLTAVDLVIVGDAPGAAREE